MEKHLTRLFSGNNYPYKALKHGRANARPLSTVITGLGFLYITGFLAQDRCLDSGGRWLGMMSGCEGGNGYNTGYLTSPMAMAILVGIILGISSALVQMHALLFVGPKSKS